MSSVHRWFRRRRARWVLGLAVVLTAATAATSLAVAASGGAVVEGDSGRCLDVRGAATAGGTPVIIWDCHGRSNQQWTYHASAESLTVYGDKCLDAKGEETADGTPIIIWDCHGHSNQQWTVQPDGSIVGVGSGRCLTATSQADAAPLVLADCTGGPGQTWRGLSASPPPPVTTPTTPTTVTTPVTTPATRTTPPVTTPTTATATTPVTAPATTPTTATTPVITPTTATATTAATTPPTAAPDSGACARTAGATRVTETSLGSSVADFGAQGDTDPLPAAIAPTPSGTSWLAWLGTDGKVRLGKLNCNDQLTGTPTAVDGIDLEDVKADADGAVVLLTRSGPQGKGRLCGGTSSPTKTMWMVRFDNSGRQVWERQVTNLSSSLGGYDPGALFVWWYNHHGTLAFDGTNYAAYFEAAITVANGSCVDIHEGDRMQVVNATTGALVSGHDSFDWGCSHAWDSHITWDDRTGHFAMVCATDNGCRIAQPEPYRTVVAGVCDGTLFGGNIVKSGSSGYWTAWSNGNRTRLEHFTTGASDRSVTTANTTQHSHLVGYGSGRMLLTWKAGNATAAQVYDSTSGATVGSQFTIAVPDHPYVEPKDYADGSVAFPAVGGSGSSVRIVRVMPA